MKNIFLLGLLLLAASAALFAQDQATENRGKPSGGQAVLNQMWSRGKATGRQPVKLTSFPLRVDEIGHIIPMGMVASGHVTPSDHLYLFPKGSANNGQHYDVVAVADGYVVVIQWRPKGNPDPTVFDREVDLKVTLEHSENCWSYVDHLVAFDETLLKQLSQPLKPGPPHFTRIPVKAGQVIGRIGFQTFDFGLIDTTVTLKGFIRPEQFNARDQWKPHSVDPFDYVDEPLRSQLLALNARKVKPYGGKIDYDIDGKLIGNWFQENTGGYAGLNRRLDYWFGHLAVIYHHLEPTNIVISIGNYHGQARQFWVKGNSPDPAKVGVSDGPVKYQLIWGRLGGSGQPTLRHDADQVQGVMLAQLLEARKVKVELFPGKTSDEVKGFTDAARIYER